MRRTTAKELLADSFRELTEHKQANKITVKSITENCGYSTATFYRHFLNKYDLMAWDYARRYEIIVHHSISNSHDLHSLFLAGASHFINEKAYLTNLIRYTAGFESFTRNMKAIHFSVLKKHYLSMTGSHSLPMKLEMYIRVYSYGASEATDEMEIFARQEGHHAGLLKAIIERHHPELLDDSGKKTYVCAVCGYEYVGDLDAEPENYVCTVCGQPKRVFRLQPE